MTGKAVYARLAAVSAVTAIVADRIYASVAPQDSVNPLIVYQQISAARNLAMTADSGLTRFGVQITSWAGTYSGAVALAVEVRKALHYWTGLAGGVTVETCFIESEIDRYEDDSTEYGVTQSFSLWAREV